MSDKYSRSGGKYSGNHTTLTPAASMVADIAHTVPSVTRISPGFLKAGLRSVGGKRRVKITDDGSRLLLSIRDNAAHQEVHIYASDIKLAKQAIAEGVRKIGMSVSFAAGDTEQI